MVSLSAYAQHTVVVNPDGTHSTAIHNGNTTTIVNPDGTHSTAIHNGNSATIVNPDGSHSTAIHNGNSITIVNPDGTRRPMADLSTLKGQTWRTASFWHISYLENAGAKNKRIPWGQQVTDSLHSGAIDGIMVNIDSGWDIGAHKAAPHLLVSQELWLGHIYLVAMNLDRWNC